LHQPVAKTAAIVGAASGIGEENYPKKVSLLAYWLEGLIDYFRFVLSWNHTALLLFTGSWIFVISDQLNLS